MDDTLKKKKEEDETKIPNVSSEDNTVENKETEALKKQLADSTNQWKRALADYQNLVKRTEEQKKDFVQFAIKGFLENLLSVIDDFEMAQKHLKDKGLELALKKLFEILKSEGVEQVEVENKEYDIHTMEAIQLIDGEKDNVVVTEHRPGYLYHGSVLRPAQVTVSKKK